MWATLADMARSLLSVAFPHLARADLGAVQGTASVFEELGVVVEHTCLHLRAASANSEFPEESTVVQTVASQQRSSPSAARQEVN